MRCVILSDESLISVSSAQNLQALSKNVLIGFSEAISKVVVSPFYENFCPRVRYCPATSTLVASRVLQFYGNCFFDERESLGN